MSLEKVLPIIAREILKKRSGVGIKKADNEIIFIENQIKALENIFFDNDKLKINGGNKKITTQKNHFSTPKNQCNNCNTIFTRKDALKRHKKKYCKINKQTNFTRQQIWDIIEEWLNEENDNK